MRIACALVIQLSMGAFVPQASGVASERALRETPDPTALVGKLRSDQPAVVVKEVLSALSQIGERATEALVGALSSPDLDTRQRAAWLLQSRSSDALETSDGEAFARLLSVSVEGLRNDDLPRWKLRANVVHDDSDVFNASSSVRFLALHSKPAEPLLVRALASDDLQQRFLAACALSFAHATAHTDRICQILIPHLRDNALRGDCVWACSALHALGTAAQKNFLSAIPVARDEQERDCLEMLVKTTRPESRTPTTGASTRWEPINPWPTLDRLVIGWHEDMTETLRDQSIAQKRLTDRRESQPLMPRVYEPGVRVE